MKVTHKAHGKHWVGGIIKAQGRPLKEGRVHFGSQLQGTAHHGGQDIVAEA